MDLSLKQGDTLPILLVTLKDGAGVAIDVSGASSITFRLRKSDVPAGGTLTVNRVASLNTDGSDGKVKIAFTAAETATPGLYYGEFLIDWGGGDFQTVPSDNYVQIQVGTKV